MTGRWPGSTRKRAAFFAERFRGVESDPAAFRADPDAAPATAPSRRQTIALLAVLALVAGAVAVVSYLIRPEKARAFDLFHGSIFLSDQIAPVAVDLASGEPTLRLLGADQQVGVKQGETLGVVPLIDHTLLLDESTGEFNMVDNSGFIVKHDGAGVPLAKRAGETTSYGVASDSGQAYIVRTGPVGGTDVYLVSQPTVEAAINASGGVRPRASISIPGPVDPAAGSAAGANGELWLLTGESGTSSVRTIREFRVPAGSSAGATLVTSDHSNIRGAAAIGTATLNSDGSGPTVVGVASSARIDIFAPGSGPRLATFARPAGLDKVRPASNEHGRLAFLLHASAGWSVVSVNADGSGLRNPQPLDGVPADARLAAPAASNGLLYTIDKATGRLFQIGYHGSAESVAGRADYPLAKVDSLTAEAARFDDAYAVARGPRVIFNSESHANALMVFTDGSRAPRTIAKSSAVTVNAGSGADALTRSTVAPGNAGKTPGHPKQAPEPVAPVNDKINCKIAKQKPHIPVITSAVPGSRTVALNWSYPTFSPQDCFPSTYLVSVTLIGNNAPQPPSSIRVQSQTGTNLSGLFPSTQYDVTVTAYINGQGTASLPVRITTGVEGPAAPSNLTASADSSGNWRLGWDSCGTVAQGCVAAQGWTITASFCDGRGVSSPPASMTVTGDPSSKHQPPATYKGNDDLLGRGLQFEVQGTGDEGQSGSPSAKTACIYSWSPPIASAMTLSASQPQNTAVGGSSATNVTLDLGSDPVRDVGGVGALVTFRLTGPDGTRTKGPLTYGGNGNALSANFAGVAPGATYTASATVKPAHGGSAVSLPAVQVTARANWPAMSLTASCPATGLHLSCDLTVNIHGLASSQVNGELFDTVDTNQAQSQLRCANQAQPLQRSGFDPGTDALTINNLSLILNHGDCTVTVVLKESAGDNQPLVFGGSLSPVLTVDLTLGAPQTLDATGDDFGAAWETHAAAVNVSYKGTFRDEEVAQIATGWVDKVFAPNGDLCGTSNQQPTTQGVDINVDQDCVNRFGDQTSGWKATVTYTDVGTSNDHTVTASHPSLSGGPPTYLFCTPDPSTFSATWSGTATAPTIDVGTPAGDLSGCGNWTYDLVDPSNQGCPTSGGGAPPLTLDVNCEPVAGDWTMTISWSTPAGRNPSKQITVGGTPPTPSPAPSSTSP